MLLVCKIEPVFFSKICECSKHNANCLCNVKSTEQAANLGLSFYAILVYATEAISYQSKGDHYWSGLIMKNIICFSLPR